MDTYPLLNVEGFNLFQPRPEDLIGAAEKLAERLKKNRDFLNQAVLPDRILPITGSFIYAHAPDYRGRPTVNWNKEDWCRAFRKLKKFGMDTAVFQASVWNELGEVFYRSEKFSGYRSWNVVRPMLEAARENGMKVFLGGYGSVSGWSSLSEAEVQQEIRRQTDCMAELLKFRNLFDGIYYSPETAFHGKRNPEHEQALNRIYREYFRNIKEMAPEKELLMSPGSVYAAGVEEEFVASWKAILDGVPLDILAPQDSVGCGCCLVENQAEICRWWKRVADAGGARLWANIELFRRVEYGGPTPFVSASVRRVRQQCANVTPYVEKCICWEALYFDTPEFFEMRTE